MRLPQAPLTAEGVVIGDFGSIRSDVPPSSGQLDNAVTPESSGTDLNL
jgi:hypothetical protein